MSLRIVIPLAAAVLLLATGAYGAHSAYPFVVSEEPRAATPEEVERAVRRWLECYECNQGELRRVVAIGGPAVEKLREAGMGIDPMLRDQVAAGLRRTYVDLRAHAARTDASLSISPDRYVAVKLEQFFAMRQKRAQEALRAISAEMP